MFVWTAATGRVPSRQVAHRLPVPQRRPGHEAVAFEARRPQREAPGRPAVVNDRAQAALDERPDCRALTKRYTLGLPQQAVRQLDRGLHTPKCITITI